MWRPPRSPTPVGTRASAAFQANQQPNQAQRNHAEPSQPSPKNVKNLTYEAAPNSATVNKLCFQPAQAYPPERYHRIHVL